MVRELMIDGKAITSMAELHEYLKTNLDFPDYYGENLDALFDCLTGHVALPLTITWIHFEESVQAIGQQATFAADTIRDAAAEVEGLEFSVQ
ncbi:barstar family protein [Bacillus sp. CGMCC 1.16541]|uniref:barstar family protein n=1 Tax=Bacillus sp. CGMCC 1.16541 TaxID=2185143 RepID=UPI0031BAC468